MSPTGIDRCCLGLRVPDEVPEDVAQLLNECLRYDPKERPSAKQIYDRLQATPGPPARPRASSQPPSASDASSSDAAAALDAARPSDGSGERNCPQPGSGQAAGQQPPAAIGAEGAPNAEPPQKAPTPLRSSRLPIRSAFATDD